jgi:hypothetical protein
MYFCCSLTSKNNKNTSLDKEQQKYITCQRTTKIHHLPKNNKNKSLVKEQQKYITCQRTTMIHQVMCFCCSLSSDVFLLFFDK